MVVLGPVLFLAGCVSGVGVLAVVGVAVTVIGLLLTFFRNDGPMGGPWWLR